MPLVKHLFAISRPDGVNRASNPSPYKATPVGTLYVLTGVTQHLEVCVDTALIRLCLTCFRDPKGTPRADASSKRLLTRKDKTTNVNCCRMPHPANVAELKERHRRQQGLACRQYRHESQGGRPVDRNIAAAQPREQAARLQSHSKIVGHIVENHTGLMRHRKRPRHHARKSCS